MNEDGKHTVQKKKIYNDTGGNVEMKNNKYTLFKRTIQFAVVLLLMFQFIGISLLGPYTLRIHTVLGNESEIFEIWHNTSKITVSVVEHRPQIWDYRIQTFRNGAWEDNINRTNIQIEADNSTRHRFRVLVVSYFGWENISFINVTAWYDGGDENSEYNGTHGGNLNMMFSYDNTTGSGVGTKHWPPHEVRGFSVYEETADESLYSAHPASEAKYINFEFIPGGQFRYAPGPETWKNSNPTWPIVGYGDTTSGDKNQSYDTNKFLNNTYSWNFNISAITYKGRESAVEDEFGVYSYLSIVQAGDPTIIGEPGGKWSTNSTNPYNTGSENITVTTITNANYSLTARIPDNLTLQHYPLDPPPPAPIFINLSNHFIWIRGGTQTVSANFSNDQNYIFLYGGGDNETGEVTRYEFAEVNGTHKYTGEAGNDGLDPKYPNDYNYTADGGKRVFNGRNPRSNYIEFACFIPWGTPSGIYEAYINYRLTLEQEEGASN